MFLICYCRTFTDHVFNFYSTCHWLLHLFTHSILDLKLQLVRTILTRWDLSLRVYKTFRFYYSMRKEVTNMVFKRIGVKLIQIISVGREKETYQDTDLLFTRRRKMGMLVIGSCFYNWEFDFKPSKTYIDCSLHWKLSDRQLIQGWHQQFSQKLNLPISIWFIWVSW